jgi:uncharacterized protein (TIGR03545 family)
VIVALLAVQYLAGLAVRTLAVNYGKAATSASVNVAHARVSPLDRSLVLSGLKIADPSRPERTLLSADVCELPINLGSLLHKQAVVDRGRISGLQVASLAPAKNSRQDRIRWFDSASQQSVENWLFRLSNKFERTLLEELPSVARTDAFCKRWDSESRSLDARAQRLERYASDLSETVEAAETNPLRNDTFFQELPARLASLQNDIAAFDADLKKVSASLDDERRAIVAGRRDDEQVLRDRLRLDAIDGDALGNYLLEEVVGAKLDELVGFFHWTRQAVPPGDVKTSTRSRGEDVFFAGGRRGPGVLIRSLRLDGTMRIAGRPVKFHGTLSDLASTPALHNGPIRLHLSTAGPLSMDLQVAIDRSSGQPREMLLVECQRLVLSEQSLGSADKLQVKLAPSIAAMNINVLLEGDNLSGDIQFVQSNVRMTPLLGGESNSEPLLTALFDSLVPDKSFSTRILLAGTLDSPTCQLSSNVGSTVVDAIVRAAGRSRDARVAMLTAEAGRRVDEQLASLERKASDQQAKLARCTRSVSDNLERIAWGTSPRHRLSSEKVGRRLPDTSLFR